MARLDIERQNRLEPKRIAEAKKRIEQLGYSVDVCDKTKLSFSFRGNTVCYFPYSGWHSGKGIKDGRGLTNLLRQIKEKPAK